jgi:hypothetical protein
VRAVCTLGVEIRFVVRYNGFRAGIEAGVLSGAAGDIREMAMND